MGEKTIVIFRMWNLKSGKGGCIALFPEVFDTGRHCSSYEHVGQHGVADYAGCIDRTRPASPAEFQSLKRELESAPYKYELDVRERRPRSRA